MNLLNLTWNLSTWALSWARASVESCNAPRRRCQQHQSNTAFSRDARRPSALADTKPWSTGHRDCRTQLPTAVMSAPATLLSKHPSTFLNPQTSPRPPRSLPRLGRRGADMLSTIVIAMALLTALSRRVLERRGKQLSARGQRARAANSVPRHHIPQQGPPPESERQEQHLIGSARTLGAARHSLRGSVRFVQAPKLPHPEQEAYAPHRRIRETGSQADCCTVCGVPCVAFCPRWQASVASSLIIGEEIAHHSRPGPGSLVCTRHRRHKR